MKLRNLFKAAFINDGSRTLMESILVPEVEQTLNRWRQGPQTTKFILVGDLALSYYVKPRTVADVDALLLKYEDIPYRITGFIHVIPNGFVDKLNGVVVLTHTPESINLPLEIAKVIFNTAIEKEGVKIASRAGLIVSKLGRFKTQDRADIEALLELGEVDISPFNVPGLWLTRFNSVVQDVSKG